MTVTDEQLAQWQALADAATHGPWWTDWSAMRGQGVMAGVPARPAKSFEELRTQRWVAITDQGERDAAFVAAARTAVPALIEALRQTRAVREAARAELAEAQRARDYAVFQLDLVRGELETVCIRHQSTISRLDAAQADIAKANAVLAFYGDADIYDDEDLGQRARDYMAKQEDQ